MSNEYWALHYAGAPERAGRDDLLRQVGKTVDGVPVGKEQVRLLVARICELLQVDGNTSLADLGCGNGLLTRRVAARARSVVGVDYTEELLDVARQYSAASNITWIRADVRDLPDLGPLDGLWSLEVIQHLQPDEIVAFANGIRHILGPGRQAAILGVPDAARRDAFYNTLEKQRYAASMDAAGTPHLGTWFDADVLASRFESVGFYVRVEPQPAALYTAHYRFDLILHGP